MAKFILIIEGMPDGRISVNCMQQVPVGERPGMPSNAARAVQYTQTKLAELLAVGAAEQSDERAARCWH